MTSKEIQGDKQGAFRINLPVSRMAQQPVANFQGEAAIVRLYHSRGVGLTASIAPLIDGKPSGGRTFVARDEADLMDKAAMYAPTGTMDDLAQCLATYAKRAAAPKVGEP
jgi:hypothetical protein